MLPYPYMVLNGILYPYFVILFSNNGENAHLVGSFRNQSLAFADSASSYAYLDIRMDDMASFHIHHSGHDDGDPSLEHAKRGHADLEKADRLNDDADNVRCTYPFTGMIMVWHIHMIMHVWRDHMLMIGCIHILKRMVRISFVMIIHLAIHIVHLISHPLCQVAISYEHDPFHEPIHMKKPAFQPGKQKAVESVRC